MKSMRMHRGPATGFTLIEMMVVLLIVAVFMALAIPSYHSFTTQDRMASEINDVSTDVELARSAAVKQGINVTICASANPTAQAPAIPACSDNTNWQTGWITFTDVATPANQTFSAATGDTLLRIHPALQGTDTLVGSDKAGALSAITFNRMGGTATFAAAGTAVGTPSYGWLTLTDSTKNVAWLRCVSMTNSGTSSVNTATSNPGGVNGVCP